MNSRFLLDPGIVDFSALCVLGHKIEEILFMKQDLGVWIS